MMRKLNLCQTGRPKWLCGWGALLAVAMLGLAAATVRAELPNVAVRVSGEVTAPGISAVYRYGGGVWQVPGTFRFVSPQILALPGGGTFRAALAWEVLAAAQDRQDLRQRLASYRLNDFLQNVQRRGGSVIVSLDAMPFWLAQDRSREQLADGPAWAKSRPASSDRWAEVVGDVVRHFNGTLGLDAYYEVWNEPDHAFRGSLAQYFELYRATVEGARRADPAARIGGPAVSDWTARGTASDPQADATTLFLPRLLQYAATTPLPALGLKRLPVDFVTWHSFYHNPFTNYDLIAPRFRGWLRSTGYPEATPLIVDEWNIAATPPYPEGDLNGNHIGAAYVAASLIAMAQAGIDRQVFQMMVDPGTQGYSGGTFTPFGLPRANFQTFRLFAQPQGATLRVTSSDDWVRVAAFQDGTTLWVMLAAFVPTDLMFLRSQVDPLPLERPQVVPQLNRMQQSQVMNFLLRGVPVPGRPPQAVHEVLQDARAAYVAYAARRARWAGGAEVRLEVQVPLSAGVNALHFQLDESSAISPTALASHHQQLAAALKGKQVEADRTLAKSGVGGALRQQFFAALERGEELGQILAAAPPNTRTALKEAQQHILGAYGRALEDARQALGPDIGPPTTLRPDAQGALSLHVRPHSVHLLRIARGP